MPEASLKNRIEFLTEVSFFSEVSKNALQELAQKITEETFIKNKAVFEKGEQGDCMFVIINGSVKVHDTDHVYGILKTGECFGEYALIDNDTRSASVTTLERSTVLKIERHHFLDLMTSDSGFAQGILAVMIKRHRELDVIQEQLASSKRDLELASSKMRGLIEGAMDAIIMFDSQFRIVLTNPSANKLLENDDVIKRNVLFFFDDSSANLIESIVKSTLKESNNSINNYLPNTVRVIGTNDTETLNEGTISKNGTEEDCFYTLILRNIEDRIQAEDTISFLTRQTEYLEEEIKELTNNYGIIAKDKSMEHVLSQIDQVAKTDATVLIIGETGTGKELVAHAIHKFSDRNDQVFVRINCGAIPANLIESELFGHKKGAFTGAIADRKGRFLQADKGTLFLDEIGELPLDLQPKLLRVIQEGEFDAVGSSETTKVDVRIIAATHRNLMQQIKDHKFREDLYYRLNVFPITIPALRERGGDITLIAESMLYHYSKKLSKPLLQLSESDKVLFSGYSWPGNVRELQNLIERAIIISYNGKIDWRSIIPNSESEEISNFENIENKILTSKEVITLEKNNILKALKQTKWKISGKDGAAALLQLPPTTLASRIKALEIERPI